MGEPGTCLDGFLAPVSVVVEDLLVGPDLLPGHEEYPGSGLPDDVPALLVTDQLHLLQDLGHEVVVAARVVDEATQTASPVLRRVNAEKKTTKKNGRCILSFHSFFWAPIKK